MLDNLVVDALTGECERVRRDVAIEDLPARQLEVAASPAAARLCRNGFGDRSDESAMVVDHKLSALVSDTAATRSSRPA